MEINVFRKSCPACRVAYGGEEFVGRNPLHNHVAEQYSQIIDENTGVTYVNSSPHGRHMLRIEKGKTRDDYWSE